MSLQDLIDAARAELTDEELAERAEYMRERMKKIDKEMREIQRCSECGVDTINYSHSFKCSWRGM